MPENFQNDQLKSQSKYQKQSEFFLSSINYETFQNDMSINSIQRDLITQVIFQCVGQSSFKKVQVAKRFLLHLQETLKNMKQVKKIKLKISGFDLGQQLYQEKIEDRKNKLVSYTLIYKLCSLLRQTMGNLSSLQIRITNVQNCTLDYVEEIMGVGLSLEGKMINNLCYELSDWSFFRRQASKINQEQEFYRSNKIKKQIHDRSSQPQFHRFVQTLKECFSNTTGQPMQNLRRFRLQISTWYYSQLEFQLFLKQIKPQDYKQLQNSQKIHPRVKFFHRKFKNLFEQLLEIMPNLSKLQLDLRNWNKKFQMQQLKRDLININHQSRTSAVSQIIRGAFSKVNSINLGFKLDNKSRMNKSRMNQRNMQDDNKETQNKCFDLIVVV